MNKIYISIIVFILFLSSATMNKNPETIILKEDEVGIIGYGSLISIESMEKTLGRKYTGIFKTVKLIGWKRNWRVWIPNKSKYYSLVNGDTIFPERILYLNIDSDIHSNLNCCLFIINKNEMAEFDKREWVYKRVDVTKNLENIRIQNGFAYAYTAIEDFKLKENATPFKYGVRNSYLKILENGFNSLGRDFRNEYNNSTEHFNENLIFMDMIAN